jgi:uncharacterized protein YggE
MKRLSALFFILLVFNFTFFNAAEPAQSKRLITVSATDYVEALPDTAYLNFSFSLTKDSPEEAAKLGEQIRGNIKEVLQQKQIAKSDILLDAASMSDRYDYENKKTTHAYNYSGRIKTTDFDQISVLRQALINEKTFAPAKEDLFAKRGLAVDQNISYELVKTRNEAEKNALKKAYEKALLKIKGLAEVSNFKYVIYRVTENTATLAQPVYRFAAKAMFAEGGAADNASAADETLPTLQRINSTVTVEAEIL